MATSFSAILQATYNYNQLQKTNSLLTQQLTTGKKINSPADNPSLYNRISRFESEISSYDTYLNNIAEGNSVLTIVQDATDQQLSTLQQMLDLADQVRGGGLSTSERNALNVQYQELYNELNSIVDNTTYNDQKLLDGTFATTGMSIVTGAGQSFEIDIAKTTTSSDGLDLATNGTSISSVSNANNAYTAVENAINELTSIQSDLGIDEYILDSRSSIMESKQSALETLVNQYQEVDVVKVSAQLDQNEILQQYALAAIASMYQSQQNLVDYFFPR